MFTVEVKAGEQKFHSYVKNGSLIWLFSAFDLMPHRCLPAFDKTQTTCAPIPMTKIIWSKFECRCLCLSEVLQASDACASRGRESTDVGETEDGTLKGVMT